MAGQAGGTLGLVNDLSVKLQKQRKQLNALVKEVKSAADSELTWKHYLGVIIVNNVIVMLAGFVAGMMLYGIGPQEGSFTAGQISATGLKVQSPTGQTDIMVQSSSAGSEVAIQAATIAEIALEPLGDKSLPYKFQTGSGNQLTLSQGPNVCMEVFTWENGTDVKLNSPQVLIAGNMQIDGQNMYTKNSSLIMKPAVDSDMVLRPTGDGQVTVYGPVMVASDDASQGGTLKVGADGDTHTLELTRRLPEHQLLDMSGEINIGHRQQPGSLRVWGTSNVSDDLTIDGNLIVNNGNMNLGQANVICGSASSQGDLSIGGDTVFGRFYNHTLETPSTVRFWNGSNAEQINFNPTTGDAVTQGSLIIEQQAEFGVAKFSQIASDVILGSKLDHTVDIFSGVTTLVNMNASGDAQLGGVDSHDITVYGNWKQTNLNNTRLFEVEGSSGDTYANADMYVEKSSNMKNKVSIGDPVNYLSALTYDEWLVEVFHPGLAELYKQTIRTALLSILDPSAIDTWGVDPRPDLHALMTMEDSSQFTSILSSIGLDDPSAELEPSTVEFRRKFLLAVSRVGDTTHPSMLEVQTPAELDAPVEFLDALKVNGSSRLNQMEVGLCSGDNPDTPEDESDGCMDGLQMCDNGGEDCAMTLRGSITVVDGYNTLMTVQPESGNTRIAGLVEFHRNADLQASVTLGREDAMITAGGNVLLHSSLHGQKSLTVESDTAIDGDLNIAQDASVEQSLTVHGDTYLLDEVRVFGDVVGLDPNGEQTLVIDATTRSMHTDGQLTVQGTTKLLEPTSITASATINGAAEFGASLTVEVDTSIRVDAIISGKSTIRETLVVGVNATLNGNAQLGSIGSDVETYGKLVVQSVSSVEPLLLVQPDIGATVLGTMVVSDLVTFDDDVDIGSKTLPLPVNILSTSQFESPVHVSEMLVTGKVVVRDAVTMNAGVSTQGDVTMGGPFQDGTTAAVDVHGAVLLKDDGGVTIVQIAATSGDFELVGDLGIGGNMFIDGRMSSPYFSAGVVVTDEVVEIQGSDDGVTIEGVLFRDGGIEITKINEMVELISEKGVTVEGATSKGGALLLRSDVNSDMLTLTNQNHDSDMANVTTGIDWAQYYHHSLGSNADGSAPVAHAARVAVATANSWTDDPGTHNSHMIFETAYQGHRAERARITKDGDFLLAYDDQSASAKVLMDAEVGHVHILGNVIVGDTADYNTHQNRTLEVRAEAEQATLVLDAGGSADSSIDLKIHGGSELTIRNVNYYSPDREYQERPTLVFNDAHSDIMTLDTLGNLWVSGSAEIGSFDRIAAASYNQLRLDDPALPELSHPDTLVHLRSSGPTHLDATAGQSSDATLTITSGPNQDATLRMIDPADSTSSATFVISNRGGSTNATLAISDGDSDLLEVIDQGEVGAARFHGDLILSATGNEVRELIVQSEQAASMHVNTDVDDATVTVTAGHNQDARLVLTDPNGDPESSTYDSKQIFAIVNVGKITQVEWTAEDRVVQEQTAILAFANGQTTDPITEQVSPIHVIALDDVGSEGNLRTTGSGQFGELPVGADESAGIDGLPGTLVPVTLTVQSSGTAVMSLTAGCEGVMQCNDAIVVLTSGDDANSRLELGTGITELSADAFGEMTIENQVQSTIRTFNMGSPEIVADGQLQSLWTSQNPTLRTTFQLEGRDEYSIMQLVDQGEYGDMAISGNGNVVGAGERGVQIGATTGAQSSYLNIVSGQEADAIVLLQSAPDLQPGLTLQDTSETGAATFTIRNDGSFATPRMQIVDKDQSSLLEVRTVCHDDDDRCVGDLYTTGDVLVGSPDSSPSDLDTGDRYVRIAANQAASLAVEAGLEGEATVRVSSGDDNVASVRLGPRNVTMVNGETVGFDITRKTSWTNPEGNMQAGNAMSINYMGTSLLTVTDVDKSATQSVGNLDVSGDVTVGGKDLESRSLVVASMGVASISVQSGDFADAEIGLLAASGAMASVTLETSSAAEVAGNPDVLNAFKLSLDGSSLGRPTLKISDAVNEFISLTNAGVVGNIEVTGNGLFGSALSPFIDQAGDEPLPTELNVRAPNKAMLNVVGPEMASFHITSGVDSYSQFSLSARPEISTGGHATSSYIFTKRGNFLTVQDSAHINVTVLAIADMGDTGKLEFSGDTTFSTIGQTESLMQPNGLEADVPIDATVTVTSGSAARVAIEAGAASPAQLTIESGDDRASTLTLRSRIDTSVGNTIQTEYRDFAFVNDGSAAQSQFQITDGINPIFTIQDNVGETQVSLPGTLVCENLVSSSRSVLGNGLSSEIVINGHISSPTLTFDADDDGVYLRLQFEDPQSSTAIIIPDESGTVMTTATMYSQLEGVSDLSAGQIDEGFGSITTRNNIMTTSSIFSDGTVQIESAFNAKAGITIGDESSDAVHFRGVVQNNIRFSGDGCDADGGCEKGLLFHASQAQLDSSANIGLGTPGKQTILRGHFDAASLSGERQIVIPDVPMGGMLHVNNNMFETMSASNVHQVAFASGATVGEIRSYSGLEAGSGLLAGESDVINLVNPRIKTTSTVIATISDPGDPQLGGWVMVTAVKVSQTDGQCTIKVTNVHPTRAMVNQYEIGFAVFNPN